MTRREHVGSFFDVFFDIPASVAFLRAINDWGRLDEPLGCLTSE
jgi:hypothetical protein